MLLLLFLVAFVGWIYLYNRLLRTEDRLEQELQARSHDSDLIAALTRRVWKLEQAQVTTVAEPVLQPTRPVSEPVPAVSVPVPHETHPTVSPRSEPVPFVLMPVAEPQPGWRDRLRELMGGQEWEAVVGGSWLNKVGVLVLVIGIALLLGYEFTHVGPAGRVAIGIGFSLTMLVSGVLTERKHGYAIFARGLIGGGWGALYFTTYAMHALPAAKIIDNAYTGTGLLLAVACGMILHSLRYRSQTVSGLAYFIAFATLELSESTPFSVLALLPLAASLLYVAYRSQWHRIAVFGLFATYATAASRPDINAPLGSTQVLFALYWLLFETFDVLRLRSSKEGWAIESFILPGNAIGFIALSTVKWQRAMPDYLYAFLAAAAALYLTSALLRTRLCPRARFAPDASTFYRIGTGSYEGPLTVSAALAAISVWLRANGEWLNFSLLVEGELLFLAGFFFGQRYLRRIAGLLFCASIFKLLASDLPVEESITFWRHTWMNWSPMAVLSAAVFYANRALRVAEGALYSTAAVGLVALVLGIETPREYLSVAWLGYAALLFELGLRLRKMEFRNQAYVLGTLGTGVGVLANTLGMPVFGARADWRLAWLPIAICAALHYSATLRIAMSGDDRLPEEEKKISWITAASTVVFLFAIAWKLAPSGYLGLTWLLLGAALFALGLQGLPKHFRWLSYFVSAAGLWDLFSRHVVNAQIGSSPTESISQALATAVCASVSVRLFRSMPARIDDWEREWCRDLYAASAALCAMTLAWLRLSPQAVAPVWMVFIVVLFEIGLRLAFPRFRLLAHMIGGAVCLRLCLFDLQGFGDALHITYRTFTVLPILASQYYIWWRYQQGRIAEWERKASRLYLYVSAILAVALARVELGSSLSVVAWALLGLVLYEVGQLRNIIDLRWQSHGIAVLSFVATGMMLAANPRHVVIASIVVACFYCAQLLSPRDSTAPLERFVRPFYLLAASALLAILLFYEVSGGMLTTAWAVEALALLAAGFPLRDRIQRLSGLALFMICTLKLFLYDLRGLETVNRILSFLVLGLILVGVSWVYTRFRDRIQRYL
jgi:uncharacterized membrane protein